MMTIFRNGLFGDAKEMMCVSGNQRCCVVFSMDENGVIEISRASARKSATSDPSRSQNQSDSPVVGVKIHLLSIKLQSDLHNHATPLVCCCQFNPCTVLSKSVTPCAKSTTNPLRRLRWNVGDGLSWRRFLF